MFTGIVEETGTVSSVTPGDRGEVLTVDSNLLTDTVVGASVAVDGCCLTVTSNTDGACSFDLSSETLRRTTLGGRIVGDRVNLERPLRAGAELGGHIVQGHVDGTGTVMSVRPEGGGLLVAVEVDPSLALFTVDKGSVTLDGVSLTVVGVELSSFEVALVPHTLQVTTLGGAEPGRTVNVEVDVLAKYVQRLLAPYGAVAAPAPGDDPGYL